MRQPVTEWIGRATLPTGAKRHGMPSAVGHCDLMEGKNYEQDFILFFQTERKG